MKNRHHVLVVDDDRDALGATTLVLETAGIDVSTAATGGEAVGAVRSLKPDLVLLDVNLPDMNGVDVCRAIKADPETSGVLVVHLTSSSVDAGSAVYGLDSGADGYIVRPVDNRELVARVRALLRLKRSEDARRTLEKELERTRSARGQWRLIQGLAHEIRNPLFALGVNAAALSRTLTPDSSGAGFLANVQGQVQRLDKLVRYLLELSGGLERQDPRPRSAEELMVEAVRRLESRVPGAGGRIEVRPPAVPARVVVVSDKVSLALMHLLENAIEGSGGSDPVLLTARASGGRVVMQVVDRGPGLSRELGESIFEPFVTSKAGKSGLGLAVARAYVEAHGGTLTAADNDPPPGATFTLELPLTAAGQGTHRPGEPGQGADARP